MKSNFLCVSHTAQGGRDENQDSVGHFLHNGRTLLVLADGMGGHSGGKMASQAIIDTAKNLFLANSSEASETLLEQIVRESCALIAKENSTQKLDGHSTCVLALIDENSCLTWLRIGDSRLYVFADNDHWWRSVDHTMLDLRVLTGELTDEEARHHPDRPYVFRSVCATEPEMKVHHFGTLPVGAVLLLCSDGVWDAFSPKELYDLTKNEIVQSVAEKIVNIAVSRNGINSDNCTALIYKTSSGYAEILPEQVNTEELYSLWSKNSGALQISTKWKTVIVVGIATLLLILAFGIVKFLVPVNKADIDKVKSVEINVSSQVESKVKQQDSKDEHNEIKPQNDKMSK